MRGTARQILPCVEHQSAVIRGACLRDPVTWAGAKGKGREGRVGRVGRVGMVGMVGAGGWGQKI